MHKISTPVISNMAADRAAGEGIGNDTNSNMAANKVLLFRFKIGRYLGRNSLDLLCILRRLSAQSAASSVTDKPTGRSQEKSNLSHTESE
jgi:hypothetical protein